MQDGDGVLWISVNIHLMDASNNDVKETTSQIF